MRNANKNLKVTTSEKDRKIKCLNDRLHKMLFEKIFFYKRPYELGSKVSTFIL